MEFRLLGPVEIFSASGETVRLRRRQERLALAVLLLEPGRVVTSERLVDMLWERPPPSATRSALPTLISRVRMALASAADASEPVPLLARGGGYLLQVRPESVDVHRFRLLVDESHAIEDPDGRSARLAAALELWRGPPLADAATGAVRDRLCGGLEELRFAAESDRIDAELEAGRHATLVAALYRLVDEHPLRERLRAQLMIAQYRCGRRAEALQTYQRARQVLVAELGLEPGPQLRAVHADIIADTVESGAYRGPVAPRTTKPVQLPPDLGGFVGRAAQLRELDSQLAARSTATAAQTCVITGTAGAGKTALAVHWAHRVADQFPDGQLYVNLRGFDPKLPPVGADTAVRGLLEALDVPAARMPATTDAQIGLYRSLLAGRRVLVLLDNARDAEQVRPLLPGAPGCLVLVTSRSQLTSMIALEGALPLDVGLLSRDEALELLANRIGADRIAGEPVAADEIIALSAQLPLALAIVAARAATNGGQPLAALARELRAAGSLDPFDGGDTVTDIRAVFSWSYHALGASEARLFRLLGLHPGPHLATPAAASLAGAPAPQVQAWLTTLARAHLVVEHTNGRYTLHDLLRTYAAELAHIHDSPAVRRVATHRALDHYLHTSVGAHHLLSPHHEPIPLAPATSGTALEPIPDDRQATAWFTANHSVLLAAIRQAAGAGLDAYAWQLARAMMEFLDRQGQWHDQEDVFRVALAAARRLGDPAGQAHAHRGLGRAYSCLGRHDEAYAQLQLALVLYRDIGDRAGQARTHVNLAAVLEKDGRGADASRQDHEALVLFGALGDLAGQARALNNIGWYHALQGNHLQAISCCRQALDLHEKTRDRRGRANVWHSLGYAHHHLRRYGEAITYFQDALELYRQVADRYHEADTLVHLGDTQHAAGDPGLARRSWQHARDILAELRHPTVAGVEARLTPATTTDVAPNPASV
ncbi:BTAD domain-containing putative transcriptional regulator [Streptomyces sp. SID13031]|uniref:BTAD domain-containing putative transcriptional regulator n=1 Tax=Streptomyces sp. SID13031 TaxID=2706046 RepID=UPI0013CAF739|nr:tetratricopeptide repeat protein [Streptomyces sp. SID13031]